MRFLEIDIRDLPEFWWRLLWGAVNDYLQFRPGDRIYEDAVEWLFFEEYDPILDGLRVDIVSLHVIAHSFGFDVDYFRFQLQCLKDRALGEDPDRDARGRKCGFLSESGLLELLEKCKGKEKEGDAGKFSI